MNNAQWLNDFRDLKRKAIESKENPYDDVLDVEHDYYDRMFDMLRDRYAFYIKNQKNRSGYGIGLWEILGEEEDRPVLQNTGGHWVAYRTKRTKDYEIRPTEAFFNLIGYGWHNEAAFGLMKNPDTDKEQTRFQEMVVDAFEDKYGPYREQEVMMAEIIVDRFRLWAIHPEYKAPAGFGPIVSFADVCTEFGVPEVEDYDLLRVDDI